MVQLGKIKKLSRAKLIGRAVLHAVRLSGISDNKLSKQSKTFLKTRVNNPRLSSRLKSSQRSLK